MCPELHPAKHNHIRLFFVLITEIILDKLLKTLNYNNNEYIQIPTNKMIYNYQDNKINVQILLNSITISGDNNISNIDGYMLLSKS